MSRLKNYILLHICVLLFSFTSVFAKSAANAYNAGGLLNPTLLLFIFLMLAVCVFYAFFWQIVIKKIDLNIGYANRAVYLIWSQIWAVMIFGEHLTPKNIVGLAVVMAGVIIVSLTANYDDDERQVE
ncbi:MAG: EamA-like transporter family protein [Firmicutes bacterium]|nr:EamA-like transporter family protein [Bacillota bacterium]